MLEWITQSETNLSGYYLFRNTTSDLSTATRIEAFIPGTNTSLEHSYTFTDSEAQPGSTWYYWLQNLDLDGAFEFHGPVSVYVTGDNQGTNVIPNITSLQTIYPNPVSRYGTIAFGMAKAGDVTIEIYNQKGQLVRSLVSVHKNGGGNFRTIWDGTDSNNHTCSTGVYYVKMTAGTYHTTQKLVLMK